MSYKDLRSWLAQVEEMGELRHVEGAHWDGEIGALCEVAHRLGPPGRKLAILFDQIQGYPKGYRVLTGLFNSLNRLALTVGLPQGLSRLELVQAWRQRLKSLTPIRPMVVKDGPVMARVRTGSDINLWEFPTPKWHQLDGGRYIGTADLFITRDPEEGWVNLGVYRVMIQDENTLGFFIGRGQHGKMHVEKYLSQGKPCPVLLSCGHDPLLYWAASVEVPYGLSEYDYAGGLRGEPMEVIMSDITGLPIPAHSELVIEGEVLPEELRPEGPFGEWTGYYASSVRPEPVIRVKRIMHREDPIITGASPSKPPSEGGLQRSIVRYAMLLEELEKAGVPDVRGVWFHEPGGNRLLCVVAIKQRYPGHAKQAGLIASQCRVNIYMGRYVIVVDDDIDPSDLNDVLWAMCTRSDPQRSIEIITRSLGGELDPALPPGQKLFNSRAIIDACKPYEWINEFPPVIQISHDLRQQVLEKFGGIFQ
ncbi:MAG: UbiD family decarboxylase [Dehalococcoidia bacterium]|nr:UbiD family decarboxylase [Dehalococcoidia bacterium]